MVGLAKPRPSLVSLVVTLFLQAVLNPMGWQGVLANRADAHATATSDPSRSPSALSGRWVATADPSRSLSASSGRWVATSDPSRSLSASSGRRVATSAAWLPPDATIYLPVSWMSCVRPNDADADGLPDDWEKENFGSAGAGPLDDPDADLIPNIVEYRLRTAPLADNTSTLRPGRRPAITTTLSSQTVAVGAGIGIHALAHDDDQEAVRFAVLDFDVCDAGLCGCRDEPELYPDPARPRADWYWMPMSGREGRSYAVTFYACDASDSCVVGEQHQIEVLAGPPAEVRITDRDDISVRPASDVDDGRVTIAEGEDLRIYNVNTSPSPTLEEVNLRAIFSPALRGGTDVPRVSRYSTAGGTRFRVDWTPGRTRGGTEYQIALVPDYRHVAPESVSAAFTLTVGVEDAPLVSFPCDYVTVTEGDAFGFRIEVDDYHAGPVRYGAPTNQPEGSEFDLVSGRFNWQTTEEDTGRLHRLDLQVIGEERVTEYHLLLGVLPRGENLVINPDVEFDDDGDGVPDGWERPTVSGGHSLAWVGDDLASPEEEPRYLKSERSAGATAAPSWFGWYQRVYLTPSPELLLPPGTIYEFAIRYRLQDVVQNLDADGVALDADGMGAILLFYAANGESISPAYFSPSLIDYETGYDASSWRDADGCYHALEPTSSGWRTAALTVEPPPGARYIEIRTHNRSQGSVLIDHVSLRAVDCHRGLPPLAKAGEIPMLQAGDGPFFAIALTSNTPADHDGDRMSFADLARYGFNATSFRSDRVSQLAASGLKAIGHVGSVPYYRGSGESGFKTGVQEYSGLSANLTRAEALLDASNQGIDLVLLDGPDESNYRVETNGSPPDLRELNHSKRALQRIVAKPYMLNVMPKDTDPELHRPHSQLMDVVSFTWNCPTSYTYGPSGYSNGNVTATMGRVGEAVRKWQGSTAQVNEGQPKPVLGFGFGVYWWAYWDERVPRWHFNQFIPFHLQRYQVYSQLVNGASGVRFYGGHHMDLADVYYRYHWSQIAEIVKELSVLYPVCAEARFRGDWQSDGPIEAMLKDYRGRSYLIATNPQERPLEDVTMEFADGRRIVSVDALFEADRTNREYRMVTPDDGSIGPEDAAQIRRRGTTRWFWRRPLLLAPGATSFSDSFVDYGVHVYEIAFD